MHRTGQSNESQWIAGRLWRHTVLAACFIFFASIGLAQSVANPWLEQLEQAQAVRSSDPERALAITREVLDGLPAQVASQPLEEIALIAADIYLDQVAYAEGEQRINALLETHVDGLPKASALRLRLAVLDFVRRQQRNDEALAELLAIETSIADVSADAPDVAGQWRLLRASTYHNQGNYPLAVADYIEALKLFEAIGDVPNQALTLNRMGLSLLRADDPSNALGYLTRARALLERNPDDELSLSVLANLGIVLQQLERIEDSTAVYEESLVLAEKLGRPLTQAQTLLNMGTIHFNDGRLDSALGYYQRSLAISEAHAIDYGILVNRLNIGQLYIDLRRYEEAEAIINMAREQAIASDLKLELRQIYGLLTDLYRATGNFAQAVLYQELYIELNEELFNESRDQALSELRVKYESDLQDQRLLTQEAELSRQKNRNRLLVVILLLGLGVIVMGAGLHINRVRSLRVLYEKNRDLMDCQIGPQPRHPVPSASLSSKEDMEESQGDDQLQTLYKKLSHLMQEHALYRDPELTVAKLAAAANSNRAYVSAAISRFGRGHFSGFVNGFRVREARQLLTTERPPQVLELIERCGFSSRSTFYEAFKREVGMTPSQFRTLALKDQKAL